MEILNFKREDLAILFMDKYSQKSFRANQLFQWLYRKRILNFCNLTDISKEFTEVLIRDFTIYRPKLLESRESIDGSVKFLFELEDGYKIESVIINQQKRNTLCISSQVGCSLKCAFCKTGTMGFKRDLFTYEIIGQVLFVIDWLSQRAVKEGQELLNIGFQNIVFMGMGEPLLNYDNVINAISILLDKFGIDLSFRKITLSSSGVVPKIIELGKTNLNVNLAISLNATSDDVRNKLMPINKKWSILVLLKTLEFYPLKARRRITIEYVMIKNVNDTDEDLSRLPKLLEKIPCKINLIPFNKTSDQIYESSDDDTIQKWQDFLLKKGFNTTIRWSKGADIWAACGQLYSSSDKC